MSDKHVKDDEELSEKFNFEGFRSVGVQTQLSVEDVMALAITFSDSKISGIRIAVKYQP